MWIMLALSYISTIEYLREKKLPKNLIVSLISKKYQHHHTKVNHNDNTGVGSVEYIYSCVGV